MTEYDPVKRIIFGYVTGLGDDEWGYASVDELEHQYLHWVFPTPDGGERYSGEVLRIQFNKRFVPCRASEIIGR